MHDHRFSDWQHELIDGGDVVFGSGVGAIQAERVVGVHQLGIQPAELPVGAGIVDVPLELLRCHTHDRRLIFLRERVDTRRPGGNGEGDNQHQAETQAAERHRAQQDDQRGAAGDNAAR